MGRPPERAVLVVAPAQRQECVVPVPELFLTEDADVDGFEEALIGRLQRPRTDHLEPGAGEQLARPGGVFEFRDEALAPADERRGEVVAKTAIPGRFEFGRDLPARAIVQVLVPLGVEPDDVVDVVPERGEVRTHLIDHVHAESALQRQGLPGLVGDVNAAGEMLGVLPQPLLHVLPLRRECG